MRRWYRKDKSLHNYCFVDISPNFLSNCLYVLESNVRHAAILGYVGAGGLGIILSEKISWNDYAKVGMILIMLFAVVFIIETLSSYLRRLLNGELNPQVKGAVLWITFIFAVFCILSIDPPKITSAGIKIFKGIFYGITHPDMGLIFTLSTKGVPYLLLETLCIAAAGTFIGAVVSVVTAFLGSRNINGKVCSGIMKVIILAVRTMPAVIYGLIFIRVAARRLAGGAYAWHAKYRHVHKAVYKYLGQYEQIHNGGNKGNGSDKICGASPCSVA